MSETEYNRAISEVEKTNPAAARIIKEYHAELNKITIALRSKVGELSRLDKRQTPPDPSNN